MDVSSPEYNLGYSVISSFTELPDDICQIDAATGEEETKRSALSRSILLAKALRRFGLKPGDVIALAGMNHIDLLIPYNASLMNGNPLAGVDPYYKFDEIKSIVKIIEPKVVFCEPGSCKDYMRAAKELGQDVKVITFKKGDYTMNSFIEEYGDNEPEELFKVAVFDPVKTYAWLIPTSGSTGVMKVAAMSHYNLKIMVPIFQAQKKDYSRPALNLAGIQWLTALANANIMPIMNLIKIQTSSHCTTEHAIDIINKYKPISTMTTPTLLSRILKSEKKCDLTCFDMITLIGSKAGVDLITELRKRTKHPYVVIESYGSTETVGPVLKPMPQGPIGNCGQESSLHTVKLVDQVTGEVVTEPNKPGEMWIRGPLLTEYYNNPEETKKAFSEDGWFKSGDLLYKDENGYYFFVDRIKMLIKYRSHHVYPIEIEDLIRQHPDVDDVCVTCVPHPDDGERAVACVVRRPGARVTKQEIKDLVANKLSVHKQLYGGVMFVDHIPMTSVGKVARGKVKEYVIQRYKVSRHKWDKHFPFLTPAGHGSYAPTRTSTSPVVLATLLQLIVNRYAMLACMKNL